MELDIAKYDKDIKNMKNLKDKLIKARARYIKQLEKESNKESSKESSKEKDNRFKYHIDKYTKDNIENTRLIFILKDLKQYIKKNENIKNKNKNTIKKNRNKLAQVNIKEINKLIKNLNKKY